MENAQVFEDVRLVCNDCGERFWWSAGEQEYFASQDLRQPKRCRPCRQRIRATRVAAPLGREGGR